MAYLFVVFMRGFRILLTPGTRLAQRLLQHLVTGLLTLRQLSRELDVEAVLLYDLDQLARKLS